MSCTKQVLLYAVFYYHIVVVVLHCRRLSILSLMVNSLKRVVKNYSYVEIDSVIVEGFQNKLFYDFYRFLSVFD